MLTFADDMPLKYDVDRTFTVDKDDLSLVKSSPKADKYWMSITADRRNGLVSVPLDWAKKHNLGHSAQKTRHGETVLQVDMFHQLHCLVRTAKLRECQLMIVVGAHPRTAHQRKVPLPAKP